MVLLCPVADDATFSVIVYTMCSKHRWWLLLMLNHSPMLRTYRATQGTAGDVFSNDENNTPTRADTNSPAGKPEDLDVDLGVEPDLHDAHASENHARGLMQDISTDELVAEVNNSHMRSIQLAARKYQVTPTPQQERRRAQEQAEPTEACSVVA